MKLQVTDEFGPHRAVYSEKKKTMYPSNPKLLTVVGEMAPHVQGPYKDGGGGDKDRRIMVIDLSDNYGTAEISTRVEKTFFSS
jgi:hypothetical protein